MQPITFKASIRRPKPMDGGLMAELFASNGDDADATLLLGRTALQDALVSVNLTNGDAYVGGFNAYLRRPKPQLSGMVACFFGEDGPDSDAITAMSLSRLVDMDVTVTVELVKLPDGSQALAAKPAKAKPPKGEHAAAAAELWKSGFPARPETWQALGLHHHESSDIDQMRRASWEALRKLFSVQSMSDLDPAILKTWAGERDLTKFLPKRY